MRRALIAVACALVVGGSTAPPAPARRVDAGPDAWTGGYQVAEAAWIVKERRGTFMYLVFAEHVSGPRPKAHTAVFLGKGPCHMASTKASGGRSCRVRGRFRRLDPQHFTVDPALAEAGLSFPGVRVRWSSDDLPEPDHSLYLDAPFFDLEAEAMRRAEARGKLMGRRLRPGRLDFARVAQGAFAGSDPSPLPARGRVTIRVHFR